jgi:tetratricopeptide (TPR) repeat protein
MALQAGDHDEAANRAQRAIEADTAWGRPKLLYARALLLGGHEEQAIDYASRIVGDDADPDPEARLELAIMYLSAGRDDDALSQVNQILLEQPAHTDALRLMAIINFRQENLDAAWSDFQDLLSSGQHTMDALYYMARISDYRGEYDRALALYEQVNSGPNAVVSQRRASGILAQRGSVDKGLEHLQRFGETHPNFAVDMIQAQAQLLASEERYNEALEIFDRVISYRPDSESALLSRNEVLLKMDRVDEAIKAYRSALRRWPDSALILNALGYSLTYHGDDYREAARLIRKALKIEPKNPAIIDSYGWVLYRLGEHEKALVELHRAYEMMPDPEIAAHIVEVLWKLDRNDEANAVLTEAEEKYPEHDMLKDLRQRAFADQP